MDNTPSTMLLHISNEYNINCHKPIRAFELSLSFYLNSCTQAMIQEIVHSGEQILPPLPKILVAAGVYFETAIAISNADDVGQFISEPLPAPMSILVPMMRDLSIDPSQCSQWVLASACASIAVCMLWMGCGEPLDAETFEGFAYRRGKFPEARIVGLTDFGKAQLLPSSRLKEFYDSVDPLMLFTHANQPAHTSEKGHEASSNDVQQTVFGDTDRIRNVVDAFLSSPYAPARHAKLSLPAVRIYLHSLGLNFTDSVGQLRAALAGFTKPLRPTVLKLSDQYGCLSHGGTLNDEALTAAECAQLASLRKRKKTWQKLTRDQSLDREFRWLKWHSFLGKACFQNGPLQVPEWEGPVK